MQRVKKICVLFNKLPISKKVQLLMALLLTLALIVSIPTYAWFSNRKRVATVAKVNSPAKLSVKSGYAEDIIQFEMSGIDVEDGTQKNFVFCVEGEDVSKYNIQIAHTTNIDFTYTLYRAHSDDNGTVIYTDKDQNDHKYSKAAQYIDDSSHTEAYGGYINKSTPGGRVIGNSNYSEKSYSDADYDGSHVQYYAEPLYWQTKASIQANALDGTKKYNEYNSSGTENKFLNYFILEVSWNSSSFPEGNDKETDLIYITAQVD